MPTEAKQETTGNGATAPDPNDKTAAVVQLAEKLGAEVRAVSDAVTTAQQYNATVEPFLNPLRVLVRNGEQAPDASLNAVIAAQDTAAGRWNQDASDGIVDLLGRVAFYVDLLAPVDLSVLGVDGGDQIADTLASVVKLAGVMFDVSPDALTAASDAQAAWGQAKEQLTAAMVTRTTTRDVPSVTGTGRAGGWLTEHGYRVRFTSDTSGKAFYTSSNPGAMLHDICQRYAEDHRVPRPRRGENIWQGIRDGLDYLLNRNTDRASSVSVPGFVLTRDYPVQDI